MNLSQLYYFRKLAEVKHYPPRKSCSYRNRRFNSISQLERELGIPLFEREGRKIELHEIWRRVLPIRHRSGERAYAQGSSRWLTSTQGRQQEARHWSDLHHPERLPPSLY